MDKKLQELKKIFGQYRIKEHESLKTHTSFRSGGEARYYLEIDKTADLATLIHTAYKLDLPVCILGGGTSCVVSEKGIEGIVVKNNCRRFDVMGIKGRVQNQKAGVDKALVFAESGVIMNQLVRFTIEQGLSGLEYQLGLPGTVGGAIYMNSCFAKKNIFVGDSVYKARILTSGGVVKEVDASYFDFSYDKSKLQETGDTVLSVQFLLTREETSLLWKKGMEALEERNTMHPKEQNVGYTYRNVFKIETVSLSRRWESGVAVLNRLGIKGKRIDDAMISKTYPNFILNMGQATEKSFSNLIALVKEEALKKYGVTLSIPAQTLGG